MSCRDSVNFDMDVEMRWSTVDSLIHLNVLLHELLQNA